MYDAPQKQEKRKALASILFQLAQLAAMMPYRLSPDVQRILHAPLASPHPLNELVDPGSVHALGFDLSHLAADDVVVAFRLVELHDHVLGVVLGIAVVQVEQAIVIEAVA